MDSKDGGPAFPGTANTNNEYSDTMYPGMSLRDWFAGQALAGLLACPDTAGDNDWFAHQSYKYADEMLRAREVSHGE